MGNNEFLKLAESKRNELIEALEQAFCESIDNRNLKYNVELYEDGEIQVWDDIAGRNSFKSSNMDGSSICVGSFCNQFMDIENDEESGETEEEWIEWYKDEYKNEEAENKLDYFIEQLEYYENEK